MTNGELIRMMGDEELAELMTDEPCPPLHRRKRCPEERNCLECWAEWLKMEVSARGASASVAAEPLESVGAGRLGKCRPDGLERDERLKPL